VRAFAAHDGAAAVVIAARHRYRLPALDPFYLRPWRKAWRRPGIYRQRF